MKKNCVVTITLVLGFLLTVDGRAQTNSALTDWDKIFNASRTYFTSPTPKNALNLYETLPKIQVRDGVRDDIFIFFDRHLDILERQVQKGDRSAVRVTVRLFTIADGAFAEMLASIFGDLIRVDPKMFLEEIREFPWPKDYGDFNEWLGQGHLLCNGRILDDSEASSEIQRKELESRIRALQTVTDPDLARARDNYISIIKDHIAKYFLKNPDSPSPNPSPG